MEEAPVVPECNVAPAPVEHENALGCGGVAQRLSDRLLALLPAQRAYDKIGLSLRNAAQPIYTKFPIIFSSFFSNVTIGFILWRTAPIFSIGRQVAPSVCRVA